MVPSLADVDNKKAFCSGRRNADQNTDERRSYSGSSGVAQDPMNILATAAPNVDHDRTNNTFTNGNSLYHLILSGARPSVNSWAGDLETEGTMRGVDNADLFEPEEKDDEHQGFLGDLDASFVAPGSRKNVTNLRLLQVIDNVLALLEDKNEDDPGMVILRSAEERNIGSLPSQCTPLKEQ